MKHKKLIIFAFLLLLIVAGTAVTLFSRGEKQSDEFAVISDPAQLASHPKVPLPLKDLASLDAVAPFKAIGNTPGANFHNGFDYMTKVDGVEFYAIGDGTVEQIEVFQDKQRQGSHPQVNVKVRGSGDWGYLYAFEPFGTDQASADKQLSMLNVKQDQKIKTGDLLGKLHFVASGAHVHISLTKNGQHTCYESLLNDVDKQSLLPLLRIEKGLEPKLCYL